MQVYAALALSSTSKLLDALEDLLQLLNQTRGQFCRRRLLDVAVGGGVGSLVLLVGFLVAFLDVSLSSALLGRRTCQLLFFFPTSISEAIDVRRYNDLPPQRREPQSQGRRLCHEAGPS